MWASQSWLPPVSAGVQPTSTSPKAACSSRRHSQISWRGRSRLPRRRSRRRLAGVAEGRHAPGRVPARQTRASAPQVPQCLTQTCGAANPGCRPLQRAFRSEHGLSIRCGQRHWAFPINGIRGIRIAVFVRHGASRTADLIFSRALLSCFWSVLCHVSGRGFSRAAELRFQLGSSPCEGSRQAWPSEPLGRLHPRRATQMTWPIPSAAFLRSVLGQLAAQPCRTPLRIASRKGSFGLLARVWPLNCKMELHETRLPHLGAGKRVLRYLRRLAGTSSHAGRTAWLVLREVLPGVQPESHDPAPSYGRTRACTAGCVAFLSTAKATLLP